MTTRSLRLVGVCLCLIAGVWGERFAMGQDSGSTATPPGLVFAFDLRAQVGDPRE